MEGKNALKLLVVDDEKGIVDFTTKIYSRKGFTTFGANDGITAVEIFRKESPHISLIDIHMPYSEIDGVETLRRIKQIDKDAVCIMVSRVTENEKVEQTRQLGASAYLAKPLGVDDLDKAITEIVDTLQKRGV